MRSGGHVTEFCLPLDSTPCLSLPIICTFLLLHPSPCCRCLAPHPCRSDEAQSLFLPTIGGKPDTCGAEYTRDSFLKQLLVYGSHTTLRCITGSSMAHTWVNLADMPTYGHPVITSASAPDLPVTYSSRHMHLAWELLQGQFPHVPSDPKLLQLCPPSVALLTALVTSWINAGHPEDAVAFVDESVRAKLVGEVNRGTPISGVRCALTTWERPSCLSAPPGMYGT